MKKRIAALFLSALLCCAGCAGEAEESVFSLSAEEQQQYAQTIAQVLDETYWDYDTGSLSFYSGTVPADTEADVFSASAALDYDLSRYSGQNAVIGTAELLHYNGDSAGTVLFYFVNGQLAGVCYQGGYDNGYYSLKERNLFLADGHFAAFENWTEMPAASYQQTNATFPLIGFCAFGSADDGAVYTISIEDGKASLWRMQSGYFTRRGTFSTPNAYAVSAACLQTADGVTFALLVQNAVSEEEIPSYQVLFFDTSLRPLEMTLAMTDASALAAENDTLWVAQGQTLVSYTQTEAGWEESATHSLRHYVSDICITDLDGNGTQEYLLSDGLDLYLYQHSGSLMKKIWSTHLGIDSLYGSIYSGDLNHDGVKEVYICDMTGTTIRYILTEKGLFSSNEDINYGDCIYPIDLNQDGYDDYFHITDIMERYTTICTYQP